jgi:hypothetical protein
MWREAVARAEKAEWLLERIQKRSGDWGLVFDVGKAAEHWDTRYRRRPPSSCPGTKHASRREARRSASCG